MSNDAKSATDAGKLEAGKLEAGKLEAGKLEAGKLEAGKPVRYFFGPNFDLAAIQSVYAAIRDGDYYGAFKHAVKFLDNLVNPSVGLKALPGGSLSDDDSAKLDNQLAYIEKWAKGYKEKGTLRASSPEAPQVEPATVIALIMAVLEFVRRFRGR